MLEKNEASVLRQFKIHIDKLNITKIRLVLQSSHLGFSTLTQMTLSWFKTFWEACFEYCLYKTIRLNVTAPYTGFD